MGAKGGRSRTAYGKRKGLGRANNPGHSQGTLRINFGFCKTPSWKNSHIPELPSEPFQWGLDACHFNENQPTMQAFFQACRARSRSNSASSWRTRVASSKMIAPRSLFELISTLRGFAVSATGHSPQPFGQARRPGHRTADSHADRLLAGDHGQAITGPRDPGVEELASEDR